MDRKKMEYATITSIDGERKSIKCLFNPKEYAFQKTNQWKAAANKSTNVPSMDFGGGNPATLTMQLFFDTYDRGNDAADVRKEYTDALWELMLVDSKLKNPKTKKGRPPKVHFQWGKAWSFDAVITSMKQNFTLFLADGPPVRATVDVTFQQVKDEKLFPPQNPTSGWRRRRATLDGQRGRFARLDRIQRVWGCEPVEADRRSEPADPCAAADAGDGPGDPECLTQAICSANFTSRSAARTAPSNSCMISSR